MSVGAEVWKHRYTSWARAREASPGYTLLVPVPGDLPVFLELALAVTGRQQADHRVETLVLPDRDTAAVRAVVERARVGWDGALELVRLPRPDRWVLPRMNNPSRNHGVQVLTGINHARGSHVILHDADLFLLEPGFLDDHWADATAKGLVCRGVDHVWDPWYAQKGLPNLGATWELCAQVDWVRAFPPHLHIGHDGELFGEVHTFDTMLRPQALSDPARIEVHEDDSVVHFNYVISTYRHFQNAKGTFVDDRYRLLLVRLFVDLFAQAPYPYVVPTMAELARGLVEDAAPVAYLPRTPDTQESYRTFRDKLDRILRGDWASPEIMTAARAALSRFDEHYGWQADPVHAARDAAGHARRQCLGADFPSASVPG